jgi:hypothetical protein
MRNLILASVTYNWSHCVIDELDAFLKISKKV